MPSLTRQDSKTPRMPKVGRSPTRNPGMHPVPTSRDTNTTAPRHMRWIAQGQDTLMLCGECSRGNNDRVDYPSTGVPAHFCIHSITPHRYSRYRAYPRHYGIQISYYFRSSCFELCLRLPCLRGCVSRFASSPCFFATFCCPPVAFLPPPASMHISCWCTYTYLDLCCLLLFARPERCSLTRSMLCRWCTYRCTASFFPRFCRLTLSISSAFLPPPMLSILYQRSAFLPPLCCFNLGYTLIRFHAVYANKKVALILEPALLCHLV